MAAKKDPNQTLIITEKNKIKSEKKQLQKEQKEQRKEAKKRAREIAKREDELSESEGGGGFAAFMATTLIVIVWLAVIAVIIKLDVGGFGSKVLTPVLKDVPVLNKILPNSHMLETTNPEEYGGYSNLKDAVAQIRLLEGELERVNVDNQNKSREITDLKAEVERLQAFEEKQADFQRVMTEFYEEVVYSEKGPGAEGFQKYFEAMDPATAEYIYRQVATQMEEDAEVKKYAAAYGSSAMKPKQAAGIFEAMTDNLELAARILNAMSAEDRGSILGVMDPAIAAKLTKIMDPES
jgi:flagellar motility protein MotE (MotC chaperone)